MALIDSLGLDMFVITWVLISIFTYLDPCAMNPTTPGLIGETARASPGAVSPSDPKTGCWNA